MYLSGGDEVSPLGTVDEQVMALGPHRDVSVARLRRSVHTVQVRLRSYSLLSFALLSCGRVGSSPEIDGNDEDGMDARVASPDGGAAVGGQSGSPSNSGGQTTESGGADAIGGQVEVPPAAGGTKSVLDAPPSGCMEFEGKLTPTQSAKTYRERPVAELLALDLAGPEEALALDGDYEEIVADLDAMQAAHPELAVLFLDQSPLVIPMPEWNIWSSAWITFTDEGARQITDGTYDGWDCLNWLYQVEVGDTERATWKVELSFNGYYNLPLILEDYAALPEVESAEPAFKADAYRGDVCLSREGEVSTYIFLHAFGDCPAGCTGSEYWGFRVGSAEGLQGFAGAPNREEPYERVVEYLGFVGDDDPDPEWSLEAEDCWQSM